MAPLCPYVQWREVKLPVAAMITDTQLMGLSFCPIYPEMKVLVAWRQAVVQCLSRDERANCSAGLSKQLYYTGKLVCDTSTPSGSNLNAIDIAFSGYISLGR